MLGSEPGILTDYWLQFPRRFRFIWLGNYIGLLNRPLFSRALEFTIGYTVVAVIIQVGLGLAVALFLHANIPGRKVMRAMMLMPLSPGGYLYQAVKKK